jgi:AmmeMemoRadiSam system protein A
VDPTTIAAGLLPHAPIIVPAVAGSRAREVADTTSAAHLLAGELLATGPDALVVTAPHGLRHPTDLTLQTGPRVAGDLARFGAEQVTISLPVDRELATAIAETARQRHLPVRTSTSSALEYSTVVPLSFLCDAGWKGPTVVVSLPYPGYGDPIAIGEAVAGAARHLGRHLLVLASGDMSHRLTHDAPAGFDPEGRRFDDEVTDLLRHGDLRGLLDLSPERVERAGEDCLDSLKFAAATFDFAPTSAHLLSYEGPFGVGYGVAMLTAAEAPPTGPQALPDLARRAIRTYLREGREIRPPAHLDPEVTRPAAVFVTLLTARGELRGCIGSLAPATANVAAETIDRAIAAATTDPRFAPVARDEVASLTIEVSILEPPEPVASIANLDPRRYGVVVEDGPRRGVLLPGLEGIDDAAQQVALARRKAGIPPGREVRLSRFKVTKHRSKGGAE